MAKNAARSDRKSWYDSVIIGAGVAGLYALHRMREAGLSALVIEGADGVGGTWYWNAYPGARVDVESMQYSYSFSEELAQDWVWTEKYAAQPELLRYINHVADRFDLRRDITFNTYVTAAHFNEATARWIIKTDQGDEYSARYCILATGCLSKRKDPEFKGLASFKGQWYQTSNWPKEAVDFTGKRVGLIGTGSTGIQTATTVAPLAAHLTVFQRTANYSFPAWNAPISEAHMREAKQNYPAFRAAAKESTIAIAELKPPKNFADFKPEELQPYLEEQWARGGLCACFAFIDSGTNKAASDCVAAFVHEKIRAIVNDPEIAELLCPKDHPVGTKRPCVDTGYYEIYNRDNVSLVNVKNAPIVEITPDGLRTTEKEYLLDIIIFAIGFDAMTGALFNIDIRGRGGKRLSESWADGPRTFLGLAVADFPNMFTITGPQSPSVLAQMIYGVEQHIDWIMDCILYMNEHGYGVIEATLSAQDQWVEHHMEVANATLLPLAEDANSWYLGANVAGKPRVVYPYLGGFPLYRKKCDDVAQKGYEGFRLEPSH